MRPRWARRCPRASRACAPAFSGSWLPPGATDGMGADDHAVRAAVGVDLVVVLRRESRDRLEQLFGESLALARRAQADLDVGGKRGQALARLLGDGLSLADLLRHARGEGDQVAAGELVLELPRVHARREHRRRGDQVLSRPPHDALLAAAALLLAYQLDEAVLLELAHVVGHLLAREPQAAGHRRGPAGF